MVELCGKLAADDMVSGELAKLGKSGKLSNCLALEAATRCLRVHAGSLLKRRKKPLGEKLQARLAKLGIRSARSVTRPPL